MPFKLKRIYAPPDASDGKRILVDRLWPRGVSKENAHLDGWLKDVAPSPVLRSWFGHRPENFSAFREKYEAELATDPQKQPDIHTLLQLAAAGPVTLLYAAKSPEINHAVVLKDYLERLAAQKD